MNEGSRGHEVALVTASRVTAPVGAPKVVALGGGHGLAASLSALRRVSGDLTAIVTVADDGGSSGRLRRQYGVLPPGDLRMALAALCGDDDWGTTWSRVVQLRFGGDGELSGHAVGNLLIVALWELLGDTVEGLDWVGRLLGTRGRVLPMASVPLDIVAEVEGADPACPDEISWVRGQDACASTPGRVRSISLLPDDPPAVPAAVTAIMEADWVVFGPGSWFTSVLPHLLVPELASALRGTPAHRLVALNLAPQPGETGGFSRTSTWRSWRDIRRDWRSMWCSRTARRRAGRSLRRLGGKPGQALRGSQRGRPQRRKPRAARRRTWRRPPLCWVPGSSSRTWPWPTEPPGMIRFG